jgi:protein-arginine kinase activator protein McsA
MTEERQVKISYDDLKLIALQCANCASEITFDISQEKHLTDNWEERGMRCTICGTNFDSAIKAGLVKYADWYTLIKQSKQTVFFRIKNF